MPISIVADFEMNGVIPHSNPNGPSLKEEEELIEVAFIALHEDGTEVDTLHSFIQPEFTEISQRSLDITNISKDKLLNAPTFEQFVDDMHHWLDGLNEDIDAWYTWGAADAGAWDIELNRRNLSDPIKAPHMNAKSLFRKNNIKKSKPVGMNKALEISGLERVGQHHSGLDDAKSMVLLFDKFVATEEEIQIRPTQRAPSL